MRHLLSARRSQTSSSLLASILLFAGTQITSAAAAADSNGSARLAECLSQNSHQLASLSACGDEGSINHCLTNMAPSGLESCFVNAGCAADEARAETEWVLRRCDEFAAGDLRRRAPAPEPKPAAPAQPILQDRAPAPTPAPAPAQLFGMALPAIPGMPRMAERADTSTLPVSPSPCSTVSLQSTTTCPFVMTGPSSGQALPCYPTEVPVSVCVDGLICQTDSAGDPVCLYADNSLDTGGLIVAIVFGAALVVCVSLLTFFCCRDRARGRQLRRAAEAAAIACEAKEAAAVASSSLLSSASRSRVPSPSRSPQLGAKSSGAFVSEMPVGGRGGAPPVPALPKNPFGDYNR